MGAKQSGARPGKARGFTLIEVMLAIAMVGLIMVAVYGTLFATIKARDQIEKESLTSKIGPNILDLIERDVAGAFCLNIHDNDVFFGEHRLIRGEPADTFHLITTTDSTILESSDDEAVRSDLTEVSYQLRENPTHPDHMDLYRRQDFHVDDRIAEGGTRELVYSRIKSFQITYYKDLYEGADEYDEWDAKKRNRFPAAMRIVLSLQIDPRLAGYGPNDMGLQPTLDYERVVFFPQGSELTMAVRPVVPTRVEPEENTGPGAGGGAGGRGGGGPPGKGEGDMGDMGEGAGPGGLTDPGDGWKDGGLPKGPPPEKPPELEGGDIDIEEILKLLAGLK